ncbi:MAG: SpoIIE family protein phosphatase [Methylacidiphilales bacterium]|nr:SpoIIE family protein phosphatase [Candidatus Methylacidiphilales bacterium]
MSAILEYPAWPDAPPVSFDPLHEMERVESLLSLKLLDTEPEHRFDRITRLAAEFFGVPTAYIAFIDSKRQWFKSRVGLCHTETARDFSFCQYTIHRNEPFIIPDTLLHPVGKSHPLVVGEPHVRFYAGVPLAGPRGHKIGTFCLVDLVPREFGDDEIASLLAFGALVEREINLGEIIETQNELLSTRQQLVETQKMLNQEFSDAAKYVRLMLPPSLSGEEIIDWQFHPSTHLGGDGLGYRRINEDLLAFYVLDVTGHGLGSALLAVTALELLRNPVAQVNFAKPADVIDRLNRTFQMKDHAGKFFSAWYGVYSRSAKTVTYANAGHPPALLLTRRKDSFHLDKTAPGASVLGIMPEIHAPETVIEFFPTSELFLFTDGLYELLDPKGGRGSYDEFLAYLQKQIQGGTPAWNAILSWLDRARDGRMIDDDVTLLRFATRA